VPYGYPLSHAYRAWCVHGVVCVHSFTVGGLRVIQIVHRSVHRSLLWLAPGLA